MGPTADSSSDPGRRSSAPSRMDKSRPPLPASASASPSGVPWVKLRSFEGSSRSRGRLRLSRPLGPSWASPRLAKLIRQSPRLEYEGGEGAEVCVLWGSRGEVGRLATTNSSEQTSSSTK